MVAISSALSSSSDLTIRSRSAALRADDLATLLPLGAAGVFLLERAMTLTSFYCACRRGWRWPKPDAGANG
jgi:hypothetical protein